MEWVKDHIVIHHEREEFMFTLADSTGKVLVDPSGAKCSLAAYKNYSLNKDEVLK